MGPSVMTAHGHLDRVSAFREPSYRWLSEARRDYLLFLRVCPEAASIATPVRDKRWDEVDQSWPRQQI